MELYPREFHTYYIMIYGMYLQLDRIKQEWARDSKFDNDALKNDLDEALLILERLILGTQVG